MTVARSRIYNHTCGFIDDNEIVVFIEDIHRYRLRLKYSVFFLGSIDGYGISNFDPEILACRSAVDRDFTLFYVIPVFCARKASSLSPASAVSTTIF
jgi:hypothetical protein